MNTRVAESHGLSVLGRVILVTLVVLGGVLAAADPFSFLFCISYAGVAAFLISRRPDNVVGWLLLWIAFGFVGTTTSVDRFDDMPSLVAGTGSMRDFVMAWLTSWTGFASYVSVFALTVLFPSGHLPSGRWRLPVVAFLVAGGALVVFAATGPTVSFNPDNRVTPIVIPNRFALLPDLAIWSLIPVDLLFVPAVALVAGGAVSMVVRYRRSRGIERLQLRWIVAAIAFIVVAVVGAFVALAIFGDAVAGFAWLPAIVAYPLLPLAIGIAVLRYRLYEIDRIVSRTIGYGLVTAVLLGVFAVLVVGLQALLAPITGGDVVPVAASTLAVAALFQPLRQRVQAIVDGRFYRARVDAERTVAAFAERLRDEIDLASLTAELEGTIRATLAPTDLRVWLRAPKPTVRNDPGTRPA